MSRLIRGIGAIGAKWRAGYLRAAGVAHHGAEVCVGVVKGVLGFGQAEDGVAVFSGVGAAGEADCRYVVRGVPIAKKPDGAFLRGKDAFLYLSCPAKLGKGEKRLILIGDVDVAVRVFGEEFEEHVDLMPAVGGLVEIGGVA